MPGIIDKIRLNSGDIKADDEIAMGHAKAIQIAYENAAMLGEEIRAGGWLWDPQAKDFLARQEALCQKYEGDYFDHHKHQLEHLGEMRKLIEDMRVWLDKMLQSSPPKTP